MTVRDTVFWHVVLPAVLSGATVRYLLPAASETCFRYAPLPSVRVRAMVFHPDDLFFCTLTI